MKNCTVSSKHKYVMVKYHFIHEMIETNEITVDYMSANDMMVDPLTKEISKNLFLKHIAHMGLKYL